MNEFLKKLLLILIQLFEKAEEVLVQLLVLILTFEAVLATSEASVKAAEKRETDINGGFLDWVKVINQQLCHPNLEQE